MAQIVRFIANAGGIRQIERYIFEVADQPVGNVMKRVMKTVAMGIASLVSMGLGGTATAQTPGPALIFSPPVAVAQFYQRWPSPIWFKAGADNPAIATMVSVLQRAPFDGLVDGPQLAASVLEAQVKARSGNRAAIVEADRAVSTAWVEYVQRMKQPTPGMTYAIPYLSPQGATPEQILLTANAAPSLEAYVRSAANPNVIYTQLRDTAVAEAAAKGSNVPDARLIANLDRVRSIPATGRFMVVDSASQMLTLYENGRPFDSMKVVAGKTDYKTPMIASIMYYIVYNPYWNAPDHLAKKIAQNYLTMGNGYLKSKGYQVMKDWTAASDILPNDQVDWKGIASGKVQARIRQRPSDENSMGNLKFPFPNGLDIFLHDTPHKEYFAKSDRMLSNGCVRLEDARRLGRWLLGVEPAPPSDGPEVQVQLPRGVPIYLTYITAQANNGHVAYLKDPYGWDRTPTSTASVAPSSTVGR
jgi:murein L,D-transpeptidase YcbB/YkuD